MNAADKDKLEGSHSRLAGQCDRALVAVLNGLIKPRLINREAAQIVGVFGNLCRVVRDLHRLLMNVAKFANDLVLRFFEDRETGGQIASIASFGPLGSCVRKNRLSAVMIAPTRSRPLVMSLRCLA